MNFACTQAPAKVSTSDLLRSVALVIPTYNAAPFWESMHAGLKRQGLAPEQVLVVDSMSSDNTQVLVQQAGYQLKVIAKNSFRHGATRQMAAELLPKAKFLVYLTQDAIPVGDNPIGRLLEAFADPTVGAAYGRQLPRPQAQAIEEHARLFNYPSESCVCDFESHKRLGVRAAFFSNSFAAYRRIAFDEVGGFSKQSIVSEEVTMVASMLVNGWKSAYQADATVIHSHNLSLAKEFSRYFDIGVHRSREAWILKTFGSVGSEGLRFVSSELSFLREKQPALIPMALLRTLNKFCGYQLGKHEAYLPALLKKSLTGQPNFWRDEDKDSPALQPHVVSRTF